MNNLGISKLMLDKNLIGIRIDILTETSLLSTYLSSPRVGHLHQALHVFKYLKDHKRSNIVFDPTYVDINDDHLPFEERASFKAKYMKELYPDATEEVPPNAPKPRGKARSRPEDQELEF